MRKKPSGIVTLITDFGLMGEYAGAMKGAILNVNPRCQVVGRILFADAFGNLITNISRGEYGPQIGDRPWQIKGKSWRIERLQETYPDVHPGQPLALFGSAGLLEIAVNRGNAQLTLGLKPGDLISINRL